MSYNTVNFEGTASVKLIASNEGLNLYQVHASSAKTIPPGNHLGSITLTNPATGQKLNIASASGIVAEYAGPQPWLGDNAFTTKGMSWQTRQIPDDANLWVRFTFDGTIAVTCGFTGFVTATN